jgi:peptide/nickel transport system substrate-binding protein
VLLGYGSVGNDLFGKGQPSYNADIPQREHDPEQAAALLKQAGVGRLRLTLPTSSASPGMFDSAAAFKQQASAAGIDITLQKLPSESYFTNDKYLSTPLYQTNWGQGFESQAQDGLLKSAPFNETHWHDPSWDAAFKKAQGIVDADRRIAAYKALQEPLWERGGYIVWGVFDTLDAASSKVHGIVPNISSSFQNLGGFEFKDHWLGA